jgi:hypothetical protein
VSNYRGYDDASIQAYQAKFNVLSNLQLLTDSENLSKNAMPFEDWIRTRDPAFHKRHLVPEVATYGFDTFEEFVSGRIDLIVAALKTI